MKSYGMRKTAGEKIFGISNNFIMFALIIIMIYPFWHILMYSISDIDLAARGGVFLFPRGFNMDTYRIVLKNKMVLSGFKVSLIVTVVGTFLATLLTALTAYPISKKRLRGKKSITFLILFTMIFSGGMVPSYLVVKWLGMLDTYSSLILPGIISAWNVFIMRNFFSNIPESLEESAKLDGAGDVKIFFRILLPVSKPVLATIALFCAVGYWNNYFSTVLYITSREMWSLQAVLRDIVTNVATAMARQGVTITDQRSMTPQTVMMAAVVIATTPILIVYPFLQKYFVQGVMIGSIKG